jgi:uncharacterized protein
VKHWKFAYAAALLCTVSVPAAAQYASRGNDLIEAVRNRDGAKAMQLLEGNPVGIIDAKTSDGDTALILAIARNDTQWTGWLLQKGADPNLAGKGGETPLIVASRTGFYEAVGWLIGQKARVDATNRRGETALIVAVQQRDVPIVRLLLESGANPDKTDSLQGYSARDYAKRDNRNRDILRLIEAAKPTP